MTPDALKELYVFGQDMPKLIYFILPLEKKYP